MQQEMEELSLIEEIDVNSGLENTGNNQETYFLVLRSFLKHSNSYLEEIDRLMKAETWGDYNISAHALKGLLATLGAKKLSEQARRLEMASKAGNDAFSPDICKTDTVTFCAEVFQFRDKLSRVLQNTQKNEKPRGDTQLLKEQLKLLEHACKEYSYEDIQAVVAVLEQYDWGDEAREEITQICDFLMSYDYDKVLETIEKKLS